MTQSVGGFGVLTQIIVLIIGCRPACGDGLGGLSQFIVGVGRGFAHGVKLAGHAVCCIVGISPLLAVAVCFGGEISVCIVLRLGAVAQGIFYVCDVPHAVNGVGGGGAPWIGGAGLAARAVVGRGGTLTRPVSRL